MTTTTVLVVGRGLYALQLCRAYSSSNCRVILATTAFNDFARISLACDKTFVIPKPTTTTPTSISAWSFALQQIIIAESIQFLIPAAEETLYVSLCYSSWRHAGVLRHCHVFSSPHAVLESLHSKLTFQTIIPQPLTRLQTIRVDSLQAALDACRIIRTTTNKSVVVVKPIFTRGGRSMCILRDEAAAAATGEAQLSLLHISSHKPYVVQEFAQGKEYAAYAVVNCGRVTAFVAYSMCFPIKGFSTVRTCERKPALLEWVQKFVCTLCEGKFSGQVGFDFIETEDGMVYALECNPRATNGVSFFAAANSTLSSRFCKAQMDAAMGITSLAPGATMDTLFDNQDIVQPPVGLSVATMLPALSLLRHERGPLLAALLNSYADMEWPSDPAPAIAAIFRSLILAVSHIHSIVGKGQHLADLAADATERELVKYDSKPVADVVPSPHSPTSSLSSSQSLPDILSSTRVLVTGATGFVGGVLVKELLKRGVGFVIATGRRKDAFVLPPEHVGRCEFVVCDLHDRSAVRQLVHNVHAVVHCAALCSPWGTRDAFYRDNVEVTKFLIDACRAEKGVTRFIHVSSPSICFPVELSTCSKWGVQENDPIPAIQHQANYYTETKSLAEVVVEEAAKSDSRLCCVTIRPRAVYGEGDTALFPRLVSRLRESRLPVFGDGNAVTDLTHVDNVVHALILALEAPATVVHGKKYNITDLEPIRLYGVIDNLCNHLSMPPPRIHVPVVVAYYVAWLLELVYLLLLHLRITQQEPILTRYAVNVLSATQTLDCTAAQRELGYVPVISTRDGIQRFLTSIESQELALPLRRTRRNTALVWIPICAGLAVLLCCVVVLHVSLFTPVLLAIGIGFRVRWWGETRLQLETKCRLARDKRLMVLQPNGKDHHTNNAARPRPWRTLTSLDEKFMEATRAAPAAALHPSTQRFLPILYGLFKQQKDGDNNTTQLNSFSNPRELVKWRAWNECQGISRDEARLRYIDTIEEMFDVLDECTDPEADIQADEEFVRTKQRVLYGVAIRGVGRYLPKRIVSSQQVESMCGVTSGWSTDQHNTGVKFRHWSDVQTMGAQGQETNSYMAAEAIKEACQEAGINVKDLDLILNASASNERILPDGSCLVKRALGLQSSDAACFSVHATCLSFVVGFEMAAALIHAGRYKRVAIVSSEISSVACDFSQPESCLLLGDGAAAVVMTSNRGGMSPQSSAIHAAHFENHCESLDAATLRTGTMAHPKWSTTMAKDHLFDMDGVAIVNAVKSVGASFLEHLRPGLSHRLPHDIKLVVPHQPSGAAMDMLVAHGWPRERTINVLSELGNCVAASTPLALYEAIRSGRLKRGDKFLMVGTGGGITLGGVIATY